jgi:hypothetical protein
MPSTSPDQVWDGIRQVVRASSSRWKKMVKPEWRAGPAETNDAKDRPVLVHVDTVDGLRLVTYHEFPRPGAVGRDAHHLVRRGGMIAGVYEGRVRDGLYRLVGDGLYPHRPDGATHKVPLR